MIPGERAVIVPYRLNDRSVYRPVPALAGRPAAVAIRVESLSRSPRPPQAIPFDRPITHRPVNRYANDPASLTATVTQTVRPLALASPAVTIGGCWTDRPPAMIQTVRPPPSLTVPALWVRRCQPLVAAASMPTLSWPIWIAVESVWVILSMGGQRVDLAFEQGAVEGLTARDVKEYIRYIADRRLNADLV